MIHVSDTTVKPGQLYEVDSEGVWNFFFDASMLKTFLDCEQMFKYKYVDNIRVKGQVNWKSELGSWWSSTMQLYYNAFRQGDLTKELVPELALQAWSDRGMSKHESVVPKSYADFGGPACAVLMAVRYFDETYNYDINHWKVLSVEEGAGRRRELIVGANERVRVYYITLPDLMVLIDGKDIAPVDHKTKDNIDSRLQHMFKPHLQTCGYIWTARYFAQQQGLQVTTNQCIINAAARNEPGPRSKNDQRFKRIPVHYNPEQLDAWAWRIIDAAERMRWCFEHDKWQWNDESCHKFSGCDYRPIDSAPADARLQVIQSAYAKKEPWVQYQPDTTED